MLLNFWAENTVERVSIGHDTKMYNKAIIYLFIINLLKCFVLEVCENSSCKHK